MNYAINREELWKYAGKGNAYNLGGFIPVEGYEDDPDLEPYVYDTERARSLLAEAGYPDGFDISLISGESRGVESQIISKMLERIGLRVKLDVLATPEIMQRWYIPHLDKPPEEQEWDIVIGTSIDDHGHKGASFFYFSCQDSLVRWAAADPIYDEMCKDMVRTVSAKVQEEKIRQMARYVYDKASSPFIYSPLTLYAVNKEVDFVPQKNGFVLLKETSVTVNH